MAGVFDGVPFGGDQFGISNYDYNLYDKSTPFTTGKTQYMEDVRNRINDDYAHSRLHTHNHRKYQRQPLPTREEYFDSEVMSANRARDREAHHDGVARSTMVAGGSPSYNDPFMVGSIFGLNTRNNDNITLFLLFVILVIVCVIQNSIGDLRRRNDMLYMMISNQSKLSG
jgi:hypothetical protein